jgi:hypothetical protein
MNRSTAIAFIAGKAALGASLALGFASSPAAPAHVAHADYPEPPTPTWIEGIEEDDPRWDCWTMGNQICGPAATVAGVPVEPGDYQS